MIPVPASARKSQSPSKGEAGVGIAGAVGEAAATVGTARAAGADGGDGALVGFHVGVIACGLCEGPGLVAVAVGVAEGYGRGSVGGGALRGDGEDVGLGEGAGGVGRGVGVFVNVGEGGVGEGVAVRGAVAATAGHACVGRFGGAVGVAAGRGASGAGVARRPTTTVGPQETDVPARAASARATLANFLSVPLLRIPVSDIGSCRGAYRYLWFTARGGLVRFFPAQLAPLGPQGIPATGFLGRLTLISLLALAGFASLRR